METEDGEVNICSSWRPVS